MHLVIYFNVYITSFLHFNMAHAFTKKILKFKETEMHINSTLTVNKNLAVFNLNPIREQ